MSTERHFECCNALDMEMKVTALRDYRERGNGDSNTSCLTTVTVMFGDARWCIYEILLYLLRFVTFVTRTTKQ